MGTAGLSYSLYLVLASFTSIRVHALLKSLPLCLITFVLSIVPVGVNFAVFRLEITGQNIPLFGCTEMDNITTNLSQKFVIISRSCLITADCLACGVTWFALGRSHVFRRAGMLQGNISSDFLVDGTVYFSTLVVLNCLHLTFTLLSIDLTALASTSAITTFTTPISAILVSRFLLRLQSPSLRGVGSIPSSQTSATNLDRSIIFDRVFGSLGASIARDDYLQTDDKTGAEGNNVDGDVTGEPTEISRE